MYFIKAILFGHMINQGRKNYNGIHTCLTKESNLSLSAMELSQITTASLVYYKVRCTVTTN